MHLSPDQVIFWQLGFFKLNATIATTWALMLCMVAVSAWCTRALSHGVVRSRWQDMLEMIVTMLVAQIGEAGLPLPQRYLGFLGTLFLFLALAALATVLPLYEPPTGSLYGISAQGWRGYLKTYLEPTVIMLPFNIIGEVSRTMALAVRLFGNMMSGAMIIAILLAITPFLFPVVMTLLGLLTGLVQAYIFCILAAVYIAAATRTP